MTGLTNRQKAYDTAAKKAVAELNLIDMKKRCNLLELPVSDSGDSILLDLFGKEISISPPDYIAVYTKSSKPVHPLDRVLALHYLLCKDRIVETNELISFRDLRGGQFYWEAFRLRTVVPLEKNIGNNIALLRERLSRFRWEPLTIGDLGARIQTIGKVFLMLAYYSGDEEFPPRAEIFLDSSIKKVFSTDDVSALAGRVCTGLS